MSSDKLPEGKQNLIIHIEGLQVVLSKRNARIAELERRLEGGLEYETRAHERGYKEGWRDASNHLANSVQRFAVDLGKLRHEAFLTAMEGEKRSHD